LSGLTQEAGAISILSSSPPVQPDAANDAILLGVRLDQNCPEVQKPNSFITTQAFEVAKRLFAGVPASKAAENVATH
jgi:hypothetical protein